jgi:segregation and condensation protein B
VIAYRQPVTRAEIEAIRGVNVDTMVHTLLQRRLIKIAGRKDVPGSPFLYRTTKHFLHHFGLKSVGELPKIDELTQALAVAEEEDDGIEENRPVISDLPDEERTEEETVEASPEEA